AGDARSVAEVPRNAVVRIGDVAVRAVGLRLEHAVDEEPHPAVRAAALHGDVVPLPVEDITDAADRPVAASLTFDAEHDPSAGDRDAEVAILVVAVPVDDDVAVDPGVVRTALHGGRRIVRCA